MLDSLRRPGVRRRVLAVLAAITIIGVVSVCFEFPDVWVANSEEPAIILNFTTTTTPTKETQNAYSEHIPSNATATTQKTKQEDYWNLNYDEELSVEQIRKILSRTKGFYTRDYSLWLGWNNLRHIIETSLLHAHLLNRTLIVPSYIYARSCEVDDAVCAEYADMVDRHEFFDFEGDWWNMPDGERMSWRLPISTMLDLPRIRQSYPVILLSEYLRLHGLPESLEFDSPGFWSRELYHSSPIVFATGEQKANGAGRPSLYVIRNSWFDPRGTVRVDVIPQDLKRQWGWDSSKVNLDEGHRGEWNGKLRRSAAYERLHKAMPEDRDTLEWEQARQVLSSDYQINTTKAYPNLPGYKPAQRKGQRSANHLDRRIALFDVTTDDKLTKVLRLNEWEILYTYEGGAGVNYMKTVVEPIRQVAPRGFIRGFVDDFDAVTEDVVLLEGEVHLNRKPGSLLFSTLDANVDFARMVLHTFRPLEKVFTLAAKLDERMKSLVDGRMWVGAHVRRGDFVRFQWMHENTTDADLRRIQERFRLGRDYLRWIKINGTPFVYDVPDVTTDLSIIKQNPPLDTDPFFLATDESSPEALQVFSSNGAIFIHDLITPEDRREFGWPLLFNDVVALVEQALLARAGYFYGHVLSTVTGGIINMRAARGMDRRTASAD